MSLVSDALVVPGRVSGRVAVDGVRNSERIQLQEESHSCLSEEGGTTAKIWT